MLTLPTGNLQSISSEYANIFIGKTAYQDNDIQFYENESRHSWGIVPNKEQ